MAFIYRLAAAFVLLALMSDASAVQAQEEERDLQLSNKIVFIKTKDDILSLANRWKAALTSGWGKNSTGGVVLVDTANILAQYAPDGAVAYKTKYNSGIASGSQLLATLESKPLDTDALRKGYFEKFLKSGPTPTFSDTMKARILSKDTVSLAGSWSFTFANGNPPANARVTMVWQRYKKVQKADGTWLKNAWLLVEMHSSLNPN